MFGLSINELYEGKKRDVDPSSQQNAVEGSTPERCFGFRSLQRVLLLLQPPLLLGEPRLLHPVPSIFQQPCYSVKYDVIPAVLQIGQLHSCDII